MLEIAAVVTMFNVSSLKWYCSYSNTTPLRQQGGMFPFTLMLQFKNDLNAFGEIFFFQRNIPPWLILPQKKDLISFAKMKRPPGAKWTKYHFFVVVLKGGFL